VSDDRRPRAERRRDRRKRERKSTASRSLWRGPAPIVGAIVAIVIIVAVFVFVSRSQQPATPTGADAAAIVSQITSVPQSTLDAVGSGGLANPLKSTGGVDMLRGPSGRPVVVYVGAEYCPFCASERWSLIVALSRFGSFSGLGLARSSPTDVYANTPTFTFRGSTYTSTAIELSAVETADRSGNALDSPTPLQQASFSRYDQQGSIPYVSIADRSVAVGSGFQPDVLAGKTWSDIAAQLRDPASPVAKAILGNANYLTAAICDATAQAPAAVCGSPALKGLAPTR
jgi:Domain of unknown function (DUF929)